MATYVIEIPDWHPIKANQLHERGFGQATTTRIVGGRLVSKHYYRKRKAKADDAAMIGTYVKVAELPPATYKRRVHLALHFKQGSRERGGDVDAYWKSLLDGLQACKAIRNDNHLWCEIMPVTFTRGDERKTVITLTDLLDQSPVCCLHCSGIALHGGCCGTCYQKFKEQIATGVTTREQLERDGMLRPKSHKWDHRKMERFQPRDGLAANDRY
jgi:hypothetical protein